MIRQWYTQTDDTQLAEVLLWDTEERSVLVREATTGVDENGREYAYPAIYESYLVSGIKESARIASINEFKEYSGCIVSNNKIMRPDLQSEILTPMSISGTGGTRLITTKPVEGFSVVISIPGLYKISKTEGYLTHTVSIGVYYRAYTTPMSTAPWTPVAVDYVISGKQRAEILKTIPHTKTGTKLPLAQYEILVVRNTEDHTGNMDYADDVYIKEINEIVYSKLSYNHTALLGVKVRATDQLSGQLPTVTALVKGVKVSVPSNLVEAYKVRYIDGNYNKAAIDAAYSTVWDGNLGSEKVWTDNPVWCLYDLLTNDRYGLADYYKISSDKIGLMRANFYLMAKYCDEAVSYTDTTGAQPVNKWRPRFACNIVLDQSKSAAEWIGQFAAIMRGVVYYAEGIFWIDIDRPKPIVQLFNMSNIKDYTQTATSYKQIPNSYEVQWINPLTNYEIDAFKLESTELQTNPTLEERKKALMLVGITNMDQAKAVAKYALLAGQYRTKFVTFKTGTDGLRCSVADIIGVQHDVPRWGFGGEVFAYNEDTQTITLSAEIEPSPTADYVIKIAHTLDNIQTYALAVFASTDPTDRVTLVSAPTAPIQVGDKFIIGKTSNAVAQFKVNGIKRDTDELCEITAVEYDPTMFAYCDDTSDLGEYVTTNYSLISNPKRASVQGVYASNKIYQTNAGVWATGVEVFYAAPPQTFWKAAQIHYSIVGTGAYVSGEVSSSGYFFLHDLPAGEYQFVVTSVYTTGKQTISDALADYTAHPWAFLTVTRYDSSNIFSGGVIGLAIENRANAGTFIGKDCVVTWRAPLVINNNAPAGEEPAGAATTNTNSLVHSYLVEVFDRFGNIRRSSSVITTRYVYTYEANYQDSRLTDGDADREFTIRVSAVDLLGRKSEPRELLCKNPAPDQLDRSTDD